VSNQTLPGRKSPRYGHLGLWALSLGPNSPIPGDRLQLAILDESRSIRRRLEQIEGACLDPGYVDFFLGPNCRPARYEMPLVDISSNGVQTPLVRHYEQRMGQDLYLRVLGEWCATHGRPEYAL